VLQAFAGQAAAALRQGRLAEAERLAAAEAERLAAADAMRTALLAAVSHDLRTPLAGIKAASSALRAGDLALTDTDREELVATVDESADRLTRLVDDLLDMSRVRAGAVTPALSPTDVPSVVHAALVDLEAPDARRVVLDWADDLPAVLADPGLLERVVANLVGNAVRYAPAGPVTVSAADGDGRVRLRVADTGPGVPAADRERVFAPFQRLGDAPAGQGVGLGLAVARGLTEAMGGTLTAGASPGGGLTMTVDLPAAR
jgi:two-component system sensor histidine kinase KdpD